MAASARRCRPASRAAQFPLILTATADKQFQPHDLYRFLESIDRVDLISGFRVAWPAPVGVAIWDEFRSLVARVLLGFTREPRVCWLGLAGWRRRWLARWIFGIRVRDPECPFRLYRREIFQRMPIQSDGPAAQIEILAKANHLECIMAEVPVHWEPREHVDSSDRTAGKELRKLFFNPEFGKPRVKCVISNDNGLPRGVSSMRQPDNS